MDNAAETSSILHFIYEENSFWIFVLVTVILGGGAAWLAGRSIAHTWRPAWQVFVYCLVLGCVVRFFHYALFGGTLLSGHYYLVDTALLMVLGFLGFRVARVGQMVTQYRWINKQDGPLRWRRRTS